MLTQHVFARVKGKLARWDLSEPTDVPSAIAMVEQSDNPPRPVLALVSGEPEEKRNDIELGATVCD